MKLRHTAALTAALLLSVTGGTIASAAPVSVHPTDEGADLVVTDDNFSPVTELSNKKPVLLDFAADWCGPCKQLKPKIQKLHDSADGKWAWVIIDVTERGSNKTISKDWNVKYIPCVAGLQNGKESGDRFVGSKDDSALKSWVDKLVAGPNPPANDDPSKVDVCATG